MTIVEIPELSDQFIKVNASIDMTRLNLYKTSFVQVQRNFIKIRRASNLFKDFFNEEENGKMRKAF